MPVAAVWWSSLCPHANLDPSPVRRQLWSTNPPQRLPAIPTDHAQTITPTRETDGHRVSPRWPLGLGVQSTRLRRLSRPRPSRRQVCRNHQAACGNRRSLSWLRCGGQAAFAPSPLTLRTPGPMILRCVAASLGLCQTTRRNYTPCRSATGTSHCASDHHRGRENVLVGVALFDCVG